LTLPKPVAIGASRALATGTATAVGAALFARATGRAIETLLERFLARTRKYGLRRTILRRIVATHRNDAGKDPKPLLLGLRGCVYHAGLFTLLVALAVEVTVPDIETTQVTNACPGLTGRIGGTNPANAAAPVGAAGLAAAIGNTGRRARPRSRAVETIGT